MVKKEKNYIVDRSEILAYMGKNRLTHSDMALKIGLTKQAFDRKLYEKAIFNESEIAVLIELGCFFLKVNVPKMESLNN